MSILKRKEQYIGLDPVNIRKCSLLGGGERHTWQRGRGFRYKIGPTFY